MPLYPLSAVYVSPCWHAEAFNRTAAADSDFGSLVRQQRSESCVRHVLLQRQFAALYTASNRVRMLVGQKALRRGSARACCDCRRLCCLALLQWRWAAWQFQQPIRPGVRLRTRFTCLQGKKRYAAGRLEDAVTAWNRARHLLCARLVMKTPGLRDGSGDHISINLQMVQQLLPRLISKIVQLNRIEVRFFRPDSHGHGAPSAVFSACDGDARCSPPVRR